MKLSELKQLGLPLRTGALSVGEKEALYQDHRVNMETLYQEMEMDSLYVNAHEDCNYSETRDVIRLHSHTFYEIMFCRSGNVQYMVGSERYRLQKGDIVIVPPGISHRPLFLEKLAEPYSRYVLWISQDFMDRLDRLCGRISGKISSQPLLRTAGTSWERLEMAFQKCASEDSLHQPGYEPALYGTATLLLSGIYRAMLAIPATPQEKPELIDEITSYIEKHLSGKITLSQTARSFLTSESTISHLFSQKLGVSFYHWVTQRRLIAAKNLIQEGESIQKIAELVGFGDYTTFYRAFKKEYGLSPSQYKNII